MAGFFIIFLTTIIWNLEKLKNSIFDNSLIVNQTFSQTKLTLANQILSVLYVFNKTKCLILRSLKILAIKRWFPFNFVNILQGRHFVVVGPKNVKHLPDISFGTRFQNIVLSSLLLFSCASY